MNPIFENLLLFGFGAFVGSLATFVAICFLVGIAEKKDNEIDLD